MNYDKSSQSDASKKGKSFLPPVRTLFLAVFAGLVMCFAFFWNVDFGFNLDNALRAFIFGFIVSCLFLLSYVLFGSHSGWRAAAILFLIGAIAGLLFSFFYPRYINPIISSLIGGFVLPFALLADSGFSFKNYGKRG